MRSAEGQLLLFYHFSGRKAGPCGGEEGAEICGWVVMEKEARNRQISASQTLGSPLFSYFRAMAT